MTIESWFGKDMQGRGMYNLKYNTTQCLADWVKQWQICQNSRSLDRDLNPRSPTYEAKALPTLPHELAQRCHIFILFFFYLDCETVGTAATPGLLCPPRVIMKMIVESMMECRLAGETRVLGENLSQRHFCPSQNPTCPPGFEPGPPQWEAGD
jgi:hypothetical protein